MEESKEKEHLTEGKVNGLRTIYYQNGKLRTEKYFTDGLEENGLDKEYYEDGTLESKR